MVWPNEEAKRIIQIFESGLTISAFFVYDSTGRPILDEGGRSIHSQSSAHSGIGRSDISEL